MLGWLRWSRRTTAEADDLMACMGCGLRITRCRCPDAPWAEDVRIGQRVNCTCAYVLRTRSDRRAKKSARYPAKGCPRHWPGAPA